MTVKKASSGKTDSAKNKSKVVINHCKEIAKKVHEHGACLGSIDEAVKSHSEHINKGGSNPEFHGFAKKHLSDLMSFADQLEKTSTEQIRLARQLKSLASQAKDAHHSATTN